MKTLWFRVTGRVQGVGFRNYVAITASLLDVRGEVWNTRDGAVEGRAQGDRADRLVAQLSHGPGYVQEVASGDAAAEQYADFRITATR